MTPPHQGFTVPPSLSTPVITTRPDVFLSYAREDLTIARRLTDVLRAAGIEVATDLTHVGAGEDWEKRIENLLRAAAKVIFLATPASVVSTACSLEISVARGEGKPVLPVLSADLPRSSLPYGLADVNYLRLGDDAAWASAVDRLTVAVTTDLLWERTKAEYAQQAARGQQVLIRGRREVAEAEAWAAARPATAAPVPDAVRAMITRSRRSRMITARVGVVALAIVTLALAGLSVTAIDRSQRLFRSTGALLPTEAERLATELRTDAALLVMLDAADRAGPTAAGRIGAAFARVLDRAERERRFLIQADAVTLVHGNTLYYQAPSTGAFWRIDPQNGPQRVADWPGQLIAAQVVAEIDGFDLLTVTQIVAPSEGPGLEGELVIAYTDPSTGERGASVTVPLRTDWPAYVLSEIGPDGKGLISIWPEESWARAQPEDAAPVVAPDWAFDVSGNMVRQISADSDTYPVLRVTAEGQSFLAAGYRGDDLTGMEGETASPEATTQDWPSMRLEDCVGRGVNGPAAAGFATELTSRVNDEPQFEFFQGDYSRICFDRAGFRVLASSLSTSAGVETIVWIYNDRNWSEGPGATAEVTTHGWQVDPDVFVSRDGTALSMAMADIDDVIVWRARNDVVDEIRVPFAHSVLQAVMTAPNTVMAVEPAVPAGQNQPRRVTVLTLPPAEDFTVRGDDRIELVEQIWREACLVPEPSEYDSWRWVARNRIEVDAGAVITLPEALVTELHDLQFHEREILWQDENYPCLEFTNGGAWYSVSTQNGHAVFRSSDGAALFTLPVERYQPFALTDAEGEAYTSSDRRTVERMTLGPEGWVSVPVLAAPRYVSGILVHPEQDLIVLTTALGGGMVEVGAWTLADWRQIGRLGENYKWLTPEVDAQGRVIIPELALAIAPVSPEDGQVRALAALSSDCLPATEGDWRGSPCWPRELEQAGYR